MQSVELKVSLRQEWDQTRWPFFPIGGGRGGGGEGNPKETDTKLWSCPIARDDSTRENGCKFIFRDD